jgi:hypothetical protein
MTVKRPRPKPLNNAQLNKLVKMQTKKIKQLEESYSEKAEKTKQARPNQSTVICAATRILVLLGDSKTARRF